MAAGSFPDPRGRRVILVLEQHDIDRFNYEPGAADILTDPEVHILPFNPVELSKLPPALQDLRNARPGVLVQSPYNSDEYAEAALAPQRFALAKQMYFSVFCMYLGAKEVIVEQIELRTQTGATSLVVRGERFGTSAQMSAEKSELEKLRAEMQLHDQYDGGPPNLAAAEHLLQQTGLSSDSNMKTLLELRRAGENANQLKSRKLVLNLSSEARSNFNVLARVAAIPFVELGAEYAKVAHEQHAYTLTVLVLF